MEKAIDLIAYDGWANLLYVEVLSTLDQQTLDQPVISSQAWLISHRPRHPYIEDV